MNSELDLCSRSWTKYPELLTHYIELNRIQTILEIGAGPNPSVADDLIDKHQIKYHLNDYDVQELEKGKNNYKKIVGDFAKIEIVDAYDLICSKMVLEHAVDPESVYRKIYENLKPGGIAIHFFATLFGLPAVLNLILPEFISGPLVKWGQNRDEELEGKFPAKYRWCRGPISGFNNRFEKIGFQVLEHHGYIGHGYLSAKPKLWPIEKAFSKLLLKLNSPYLCSNSILVLRKPLGKSQEKKSQFPAEFQ